MGTPADPGLRIVGWSHIPDEILFEIISRLPVKDVVRWQCVSRKWKDIISNIDFVRLHMRCSMPLIMVEDYDINNCKYFLDKWWETKPENHKFELSHEYFTQLSHDGLLVMKLKSDFVIHNPFASREHVRIILSAENYGNIMVHGIYWHPKLKEYCIIFVVFQHPDMQNYHIVNLGSNPLCREVKNPWNRQRTNMVHPEPHAVLIDNYLYQLVVLQTEKDWCIMEFEIITEAFKRISCPHKLTKQWWEEDMNLLNIDEKLSFIQICVDEKVISINIWKLKDREGPVWICFNYKVVSPEVCWTEGGVRAIASVDGKLVIGSYKGLYICDLKMGIAKFVGGKDFSDSGWISRMSFPVLRYVMSLASLANCKSEIHLNI